MNAGIVSQSSGTPVPMPLGMPGYSLPRGGRDGHPDAIDWMRRVQAAGSDVSSSTLAAVSTFCDSIDAAGIRSSFTRLSLMCGNSLTAALVPLYTGGSRGTVVGNSTDTNVNFVSGDYVETGVNAGLKGNATNKYLRTGVTPALLASVTTVHLSHSGKSFSTGAGLPSIMGSYDGANSYYEIRSSASSRETAIGGGGPSGPLSTTESHQIVSRSATNSARLILGGGVAITSTASVSPSTSTREFSIFCLNLSGTFSRFNAMYCWAYSIGGNLTDEQARQFSLAMATFNFALGRI